MNYAIPGLMEIQNPKFDDLQARKLQVGVLNINNIDVDGGPWEFSFSGLGEVDAVHISLLDSIRACEKVASEDIVLDGGTYTVTVRNRLPVGMLKLQVIKDGAVLAEGVFEATQPTTRP